MAWFFSADLMLLPDHDMQHSLALKYYVAKTEAWPVLEVKNNLLALLSSALDSCTDGSKFCWDGCILAGMLSWSTGVWAPFTPWESVPSLLVLCYISFSKRIKEAEGLPFTWGLEEGRDLLPPIPPHARESHRRCATRRIENSPLNTSGNQKLLSEQIAVLIWFDTWGDKVFRVMVFNVIHLHMPTVTDSKAPEQYFQKH